MTDAIEVDNHRLDRTSQIILQVLRDRGGTATTSLLAERADERDDDKDVTPSHIRYRFSHHLSPLGFVEQAGQIEREGGTWDAYSYRLTDCGREFLDQHQERVLNAVDAATATERLRETRRTVDRFDERLDSTEDDIAQLFERVETAEERLARAEGNIDQFHNDLERRRSQLEERLDERLASIEGSVKNLREWGSDVSNHLNKQQEEIQQLQGTVAVVREQTDTVSERIGAAEDKIGEIQEAIENSPLQRFF